MLATLCLLPLFSLPFTYAATEILDASNSSLVFSPGWSQELSSSTGDSLLQTDSFGGSLTASLPNSTSSVSYVGFNTAGESMYGYSIDCEDDCVLQTVNASDPSLNDGETASEPSTLFTINLDPSSQHILRVYNIPSGPDDGAGQINFDHLSISVQDDAASSPTSATDILQEPISSTVASARSTSSTSSSSSTAKVHASSAKATPSSVSVTPSSVPTVSATSPSPSLSASGDDQPSGATPVLPVKTSAAASSSGSSTGPSKSVIIAATVLSLVFAGGFVAALVVFLRQRRRKRNSYASSQSGSGSLSPTGSIIPIMRPPGPEMRTASLNPFSDPLPAELPLDSPNSSSMMQRRMDSRSTSPASPGAPPNMPLPDLPLDRRPKMESRNELWIARTPVKSQFSAV